MMSNAQGYTAPVTTGSALAHAQLALRLEHLQARTLAENVARLGAGETSLFSTQLDAAYAALRASAQSPDAAETTLHAAAQDIAAFAGLAQVPTPASASPDAVLFDMTRTASSYQALADGIARQYSLLSLAIRGAR